MRTPEKLNERSLELHRLIARRLRAEPHRFEQVHTNLRHWRTIVSPNTMPYIARWEAIVAQGMEHALAIATEDSEAAADLRQASPFAGVLDTEERAAFFRNWRWN